MGLRFCSSMLLTALLIVPGVQADSIPLPLVVVLTGDGDAELTLRWTIEGGVPDVLHLIRWVHGQEYDVIPLNPSDNVYVEVGAEINATYWIYVEAEGFSSMSNFFDGSCRWVVTDTTFPYYKVRPHCMSTNRLDGIRIK